MKNINDLFADAKFGDKFVFRSSDGSICHPALFIRKAGPFDESSWLYDGTYLYELAVNHPAWSGIIVAHEDGFCYDNNDGTYRYFEKQEW